MPSHTKTERARSSDKSVAKASGKLFGTMISPPSSFKKLPPPSKGAPKKTSRGR